MKNIFVFTAGDRAAREHLDASIINSIEAEKVFSNFPASERGNLKRILEKGNGFYAWGATPGPQNIPRWNTMAVGDYVLCVYDNTYHYVAQLLGRYDNEGLARSVWGENDEGNTGQYLYFLTKPHKIDITVRQLEKHLHKTYMGFTKISDEKLENITKEFENVDNFINAVILKREYDPVQVEFADIIKKYHKDGIVFRSATQGVRYFVESLDDTGCTVARIDANEPERITFASYKDKKEILKNNEGKFRFNDFDSTAARRSTFLQAIPFGLSADRETILDLSDEQNALSTLGEIIKSLNVDKSSGKPRRYKPAMLCCVIDGLDSGELAKNDIEFNWIAPKFKEKMRSLGEEVTEEQAAMAFYHLTNDMIWLLAYKDPRHPLQEGAVNPGKIREGVKHAIIKDTFWRVLENSDGRKEALKAIEKEWWPEGSPREGGNLIREGLEEVLTKYATARANEKFGIQHGLWKIFGGLQQALATSDAVKRRPELKVTWSVGQANWAKVPWIAFLDERETNTTQRGVYCVLLFRQDMSGVYLTFNQGVTEPKRQHGPKEGKTVLQSRAEELRTQCAELTEHGFTLDANVDLRADPGLGTDYEASTIAYKLYEAGRVPDDAAILEDLNAVLNAYDRYLTGKLIPRSWIFQANPAIYKLSAALRVLSEMHWTVKQYTKEIHAGDKAFLWESGDDAGILAIAEVITEPGLVQEDPSEREFYVIKEKAEETVQRVGLRIERLLPERIKRDTLKQDPVLSTLAILKAPQGTNFPVTPEQADAIEALINPSPIPADLAAIHAAFSEALKASNISFGSRHDDVIRSFISSLATKRLVILTGLSGSGKTQIAIKLGEWLGAERRFVVAVRPDWTGSEALFGYEDALQQCSPDGRRAWHVPDVLKFMLKAARDPQNPYLLVLDEMNLAHVERYFADVLSGMESMEPCLPNLNFQDGYWRLAPGEKDRLPYPKNLFIVGTVNVDETTYMFSPKVLDRANTLEFRVGTSDLSGDAKKPKACEPGDSALVRGFREIAEDEAWHLKKPATHLSAFLEHLRTLHSLLSEGGFEFGHRVFYEAVRFAAMHEAAGDNSLEHALDLQVMQKVLPRLHGSRRRLEPTLCSLGQFCFDLAFEPASQGAGSPDRFNPLAPPQGEPRLPISFDKIQRMTVGLRANQFVSFTE